MGAQNLLSREKAKCSPSHRRGTLKGVPTFKSLLSHFYGQTPNEDPGKSEFESKRILNDEGGLS